MLEKMLKLLKNRTIIYQTFLKYLLEDPKLKAILITSKSKKKFVIFNKEQDLLALVTRVIRQ
jgi:hypothetical protein